MVRRKARYSLQDKLRAITLLREGHTYQQVSEGANIPKTTIREWVLRERKLLQKAAFANLVPTQRQPTESVLDGDGDSASPGMLHSDSDIDREAHAMPPGEPHATRGGMTPEEGSSAESSVCDDIATVKNNILGVRKKITKLKKHAFMKRGRRPKIVGNDMLAADVLQQARSGDSVPYGGVTTGTHVVEQTGTSDEAQLVGIPVELSGATPENSTQTVSNGTASSSIVPGKTLSRVRKDITKLQSRGVKKRGPGRPSNTSLPGVVLKRKPHQKKRGRRPKNMQNGWFADHVMHAGIGSLAGTITSSGSSVRKVQEVANVPGIEQLCGVTDGSTDILTPQPTPVPTGRTSIMYDAPLTKKTKGVRKNSSKIRSHGQPRKGPGRPPRDKMATGVVKKRKPGRPKGSRNKTTLAKLNLGGHGNDFFAKHSPRSHPEPGFFTEEKHDQASTESSSISSCGKVISDSSPVQSLPVMRPGCSSDATDLFNDNYERSSCEFRLGVLDSDDEPPEITTHQALLYCELLTKRAEQQGEDTLVAELQNLRKILSEQLDSLMRNQTKITDFFSQQSPAR